MNSARVSIARCAGHEDVVCDDVLAAGSLQAHHVPGVIDFDLGARHHQMDAGAARFRIGASEHHPLRVIDAAAELPSPVDAIPALDRVCSPLP